MQWYFGYDWAVNGSGNGYLTWNITKEILIEQGAINFHPVKFSSVHQSLRYDHNRDDKFTTDLIFQAEEGFDLFVRLKYLMMIVPIPDDIARLIIKDEIVSLRDNKDLLDKLAIASCYY